MQSWSFCIFQQPGHQSAAAPKHVRPYFRDRVTELKTLRGCESVPLSIEVSIPVTENLPKQSSDVLQTRNATPLKLILRVSCAKTTVNSMPNPMPSKLPKPNHLPLTPSSTHQIPPSNAPSTSQIYSQNSSYISNTADHYPSTPPSPDASSHHPSPTGNPPTPQRTA